MFSHGTLGTFGQISDTCKDSLKICSLISFLTTFAFRRRFYFLCIACFLIQLIVVYCLKTDQQVCVDSCGKNVVPDDIFFKFLLVNSQIDFFFITLKNPSICRDMGSIVKPNYVLNTFCYLTIIKY